MQRFDLFDGLRLVGRSVRQPELLVVDWRDRHKRPEYAPTSAIFAAFFATAFIGLFLYGLTMGLHRGIFGMWSSGLRAPIAAGVAWTLALPSLYILNRRTGSDLDASTTTLAALITCAFGALAMLAGAPVNWFFTLALPYTPVRWLINLVIFAGVSVAMTDVFFRVMGALEPRRSRAVPAFWLMIVGLLGFELMLYLDLFNF